MIDDIKIFYSVGGDNFIIYYILGVNQLLARVKHLNGKNFYYLSPSVKSEKAKNYILSHLESLGINNDN